MVYARILAIGGHLGKSPHFYVAHRSNERKLCDSQPSRLRPDLDPCSVPTPTVPPRLRPLQTEEYASVSEERACLHQGPLRRARHNPARGPNRGRKRNRVG